MTPDQISQALDRFPRAKVAHSPTPLEPLGNLGRELGLDLYAKRDDCTGIGFGGNKVRQLEFYIGDALAKKADTVLITGAVQSNFVRTTAAMAGRFGMDCHIQLEERVSNPAALYRENGNVLLSRLLGATLHSYAEGEDESGADASLQALAGQLREQGKRPYVISLGADSSPVGALGYVVAALELAAQIEKIGPVDTIFVPSGSALTHIGLLYGVRALGLDIAVQGVCVRRDRAAQSARVAKRFHNLDALLGFGVTPRNEDFDLDDTTFAPGYGKLNDATRTAITRMANREGLFVDPVYSGKTLAAVIAKAEAGEIAGKRVIFMHTGGQPAIFAYADQLAASA